MKHDYIVIDKMIKHANNSIKYVNNMTYQEFCIDERTNTFSVFSLSQLGELVAKISIDTRNKYPNIPWSQIKGLRNRIIHDYEGVNMEFVWEIMKDDIPTLITNLSELKEKL